MPDRPLPSITPLSGKQKAGAAAAGAGVIAAILAAVFAVEGGYVNDPRDPGGETNHGVTRVVAVANGYTGPMRDLTKERAAEIYERAYVDKPGFRSIAMIDPPVGEELVDSGVNAGTERASRWFQETLNHLNSRGADYADVAVDGRVGAGTVAAYQALRRKRGPVLTCQLTLKLLDAKQAQHYASLAGTNTKFEAFMVGWVRTRIGNVDLARCRSVT